MDRGAIDVRALLDTVRDLLASVRELTASRPWSTSARRTYPQDLHEATGRAWMGSIPWHTGVRALKNDAGTDIGHVRVRDLLDLFESFRRSVSVVYSPFQPVVRLERP